jgi:hypothetical protein
MVRKYLELSLRVNNNKQIGNTMNSNTLAPSATMLTVSNQTEENYPFSEVVTRIASQKAKGATREKWDINKNKLVSSVCSDYRNHFAMIYGKSDRLPSQIFDKIVEAVEKFITETIKAVNITNAVSVRKSFAWNERDLEVFERVEVRGKNVLALKEQLLGVNILITSANNRLKDLEKKPTPDYDAEKTLKHRIMKLEITKTSIETDLKKIEQAVK